MLCPEPNPEVSVVIVSFNTRDILKQCLATIYKFTKRVTFEIIIVDNASVDGTAEMIQAEFPSVTLLQNDRNTGFSAGQNRGLKVACGKYALVLNSDVLFTEDTIGMLVDYLTHSSPEVGVVGPRVLNNDGTLAPSARRSRLATPLLALSVVNRHFPYSHWVPQRFLRKSMGPVLSKVHDNFSPHNEIRFVEFVDGMCCLMKRSVLEQVGLFDEQFFFDYEVQDLFQRIRGNHWQIVYHPGGTVIHLKHSSRKKVRRILVETTRSEFTYLAKYYPGQIGPLRWITCSVVGAKMLLNRIAQFVTPNQDRATEYGVLHEVFTVARTFQRDAVSKQERIPSLEPRKS